MGDLYHIAIQFTIFIYQSFFCFFINVPQKQKTVAFQVEIRYPGILVDIFICPVVLRQMKSTPLTVSFSVLS